MDKILITGGAGFIGSNLALKLLSKGYEVTVLDNLSPQIHGGNPEKDSTLFCSIKGKVTFIHGSVTSKDDWLAALNGQDAVIHLAAETGTGQSMYDIERYNKVNVLGTAILWDILANREHKINKVIVASSRAVYGEGKYMCSKDGVVYPLSRKEKNMNKGDFKVKCPICNRNVTRLATTEDSKIHPTSIYGFTKQAQEEISMIAGKSLNIPVVALRYQNVYGPGQSLSNPYTGILSIFSTRILNGNEIHIFEDGKECRDFIYINDVVDATILVLESSAKVNFQYYNVGTGVPTDIILVAKTLRDEYHFTVPIKITGNYRLGDIRDNYADTSKIKNELGFVPKNDFAQGISQFVKWVNMQQVNVDKYDSSIEEMKKKGLFK